VRLAPAALAAYELHSLLGSAMHATAAVHWLQALSFGSAVPWIMLALCVMAGALLREIGRGLPRRATDSRVPQRRAGGWLLWSLALVCLLGVCVLLAGTLVSGQAHLVTGGLGSVGWASAVPAALLAGLVLSDAFHGALRALARRHGHPPHLRRQALPVRRVTVGWPPVPAPLLAGWSDRGPPAAAALAAISLVAG
jgi:hypothetical protein